MTIKISLSLTKAADSVPIIAPSPFKMPSNVARLKSGESRANDYHKYFWGQLGWKDSELERNLNELADKAAEKGTLKLYCECGELDTCHGNTIRDYLVWHLSRKGFDVRAK